MGQGLPKGTDKEPKEPKKEVEGHPKEAKKPQNIYTQTKYTQSADPPPYRGRLVSVASGV